jgi:hypothetical protein
VLTKFPESGRLIVIMFPRPLEKVRDNALSGLGRIKFYSLTESEIHQIIGKSLDVIKRKLGFTEFTPVSPVVS